VGHLHEVVAGDFYHQQVESVPEQTWSSAAFLSSTVHGLLGLAYDGQANRVEFAPHLPAAWDKVSIENIRTRGGKIAFELSRVPEGLRLDADNSGEPVDLLFSPEIPLGARMIGAEVPGKKMAARRDDHAQDAHATLNFSLPAGKSHCLIRFEGGVSVGVKSLVPLEGDASKGLKITAVTFHANTLAVDVDVNAAQPAPIIVLRTVNKPLRVQGATLLRISANVYELTVQSAAANGFTHAKVAVDF
jgi:hypothetical protein